MPDQRSTAWQVFRGLRLGLAVLLSVATLVGAGRLVLPATAGAGATPPGVRAQLAFLRNALDHGAGEEAQGLFPEGYFFLSELYGLTWVELGMRAAPGQRAEALREARWALARLDAPAGRAPFSPDLVPAYGVFYRGWTNWLRGGILALQPAGQLDPVEQQRFEADSTELAAAFDGSASPFLAAYPGQAWPVDSVVAIASLRLHDAIRPAEVLLPGGAEVAPAEVAPARFGGTVARWLTGVRARLDPLTGLIPHRVDLATGTPTEEARATSQSLIERFLVDIDPDFARAQYLAYRDQFVRYPLGLGPAVREFPSGVDGQADVDSGPLPLGVSLSATVVTLGAAQVENDAPLAGALANYGEFVGAPLYTPGTKRYAFGVLPIGDAFLAWSKTARPWVARTPVAPPASVSGWWRLPLLTVLAVLGLGPWLPALLRLRRGRRWPPGAPTVRPEIVG
jgi:hypothetical protein